MSSSGIRFGEVSDLDFIMSLERESLALPWPLSSVLALLEPDDEGPSFSFACVAPSAGYVGVAGVLDEAEIGNLVVSPECRGQGAGYSLMKFALDELHRRGVKVVFLEVETSNNAAIALYKKCGFAEYGRRTDYYGPGRDAVLMRKNL